LFNFLIGLEEPRIFLYFAHYKHEVEMNENNASFHEKFVMIVVAGTLIYIFIKVLFF